MKVKIYLRAIVQDTLKVKVNHLALFDSNRNGEIDTLKTVVKEGDTILWKLDRCSGIKSIEKIYPDRNLPHPVFKTEPTKLLLCKGFKLQIEKGLVVAPDNYVEEKYFIKCTLCDNTDLTIDPYIRVEPVK
jgi:hypothetical protein